MPSKISNDILEARLKCRYKAHLKTAGERGEPHDYELLLNEARTPIRAAARVKLLARYANQEVPSGLPLSADVLQRGQPLLLDALFEDADLSLRFDALVRVEGGSPLGGFHYLPVLFHEAERFTPDLRVLVAVLGEVLGTIQGKVPPAGIVIHGRACAERRPKFAGVAKQARRLLRELREGRGGPAPRLMLNDHCQACEFRRRCHAEVTTKDDLSLLGGMGEAEVAKYAKRGIFTVGQLACTFRPPRRMKKPKDRKVTHSHALQALAIRDKKVHVLGTPVLPNSPKRLYLDLEGDPERGFCYLAGVLVRDGDSEERHSFWIDSAAEEAGLLSRFLDLAAKHPDAWLYAYGSYEAAFLRRVGKAVGREEEVAKVLARLCNVLSAVYLHVYFPVPSNGLKDIAGHLGFRWTEPGASGLMSVVWRRRWEQASDPAWKDKLTTYNLEDCEALRRVTEFLYAASPHPQAAKEQRAGVAGQEVARVEDMQPVSSRREWCKADFAVADFEFVNQRAYFDYQRDRVYVRSSKALKRSQGRQRRHQGKKNLRADRCVQIGCEACPSCGGTELTRTEDGRLARLVYDLQVGRGAVRRRVTRFTTSWHRCAGCGKRFLPEDYLRLDEHGHGLKCWAMYKHVAHRTPLEAIAAEIGDCFGLPVPGPAVHFFKGSLGRRYEATYRTLLAKIVAGPLVHADETEVHLRDQGKGYVWVFTNLEEVVFLYRKSREGSFLSELLKGFRGVLVSDFYAAYDALDCPQQKCLVHLMRDFNNDIQAHPWDEELKLLASAFGGLLRGIVETIDRHGLKARHLSRHQRAVDGFFDSVAGTEYRSGWAEGYRERLLRHRDKLFTFLGYDGIPWNNNNAEHAIKHFAYYREVADRLLNEKGLADYLVLLSLRLTCKYKGLSFLKFLLSRQTDIETFAQEGARKKLVPALELQPEGVPLSRRSRRLTWDKMHRMDEQSGANGEERRR
jgi:predicted RecB family nuclease